MSRFEVDLIGGGSGAGSPQMPRRRALKIIASIFVAVVIVALAGCYLYWRSLVDTPQYSLAVIVDAAKRDDKNELATLVDLDAIADDFTPQVIAKAVELYGRGLPPQVVGQLKTVADPVMPAIKDKARAALPKLIRDRVAKFSNVPFPLMVIGASRYLDVETKGDLATVHSKVADRPLELKMKRVGTKWVVIGVTDDALATDIARKVGEEIIAIATNGGAAGKSLGVSDLSDLLRRAEDILQ